MNLRFMNVSPAGELAVIAVTVVLIVTVVTVLARRIKAVSKETERRKWSAGTLAAVAAFVVCTSVSLNTSYRFTHDGLGMTGVGERVLSCAAFESLIAMCVLGARERLATQDTPGWFGSAVWIFAGLSSVPAWHEGHGLTTDTVVRVIVGSFGAALAAHSALGLELRHRDGSESQAPMAVIARDLRERLMASLGLSHRNRTALEIARERAMDKAVDLADEWSRMDEGDRAKRRGRRLARRLAQAQDRAGIATDEAQRADYRARVAQRKFSTQLEIADAESPWHTGEPTDAEQKALNDLEARVRHMEDLAAEAEDAVAAQIGTQDGTDADQDDEQTEARVPGQRQQAEEWRQQETALIRTMLEGLPTKRAKLEALYRLRITVDDPNRTTNSIAERLLEELNAMGFDPLDRGAANRYVGALRPAAAEETTVEARTPADELIDA